MTIKTLMDRLAGEEYEWTGVDPKLCGMAEAEVEMAVLTGTGPDKRAYLFRLPVEKLRKK